VVVGGFHDVVGYKLSFNIVFHGVSLNTSNGVTNGDLVYPIADAASGRWFEVELATTTG
jgi:hypothetical protein